MKNVRHVRQGKNDFMCGQCCISMITGQDVQEIVELMGTDDGTTGEEVSKALRHLGIRCSEERKLKKGEALPRRAILHMSGLTRRGTRDKRWGGHWVLLWDGIIYDPDEKEPMGVHWYTAREMGAEISSLRTKAFFEGAIEIRPSSTVVSLVPAPKRRAAGRR